MNNDCLAVDELILEIADYKNNYADMAAEKLLRKCSTSWSAYQYLRDRVHDGCTQGKVKLSIALGALLFA